MAQERIEILYDRSTGQIIVGAPMSDMDQKTSSIKVLLSAIDAIISFKPKVIQPASSLPGNGHIPLKVTH